MNDVIEVLQGAACNTSDYATQAVERADSALDLWASLLRAYVTELPMFCIATSGKIASNEKVDSTFRLLCLKKKSIRTLARNNTEGVSIDRCCYASIPFSTKLIFYCSLWQISSSTLCRLVDCLSKKLGTKT